jgi:hypothetical protein
MKSFLKIISMSMMAIIILMNSLKAQNVPITFEPGGFGSTWIWNTFENGPNSPIQIVANPNTTGINTSANCASMTALQIGQPWVGFETIHPGSLPPGPSAFGTFTLDSSNCIVKMMVYKSVISDVGIKFATAGNASTGEIKVSNTLINQWEELTFDFSSKIGQPSSTGIDQLIIFPDFQARLTDNLCYIDNVSMSGTVPVTNMNVKFAVQNADSTPVYVFGNWNNWSNWPGTPMSYNSSNNTYEVTLPIAGGGNIEYLFVNGVGPTKEVLNPAWSCTNSNPTYTNRLTILGTADTTLCNTWEQCTSCTPASVSNLNQMNVRVIIGVNGLTLYSNEQELDELKIVEIAGRTIFNSNHNLYFNKHIDVHLNPSVIYVIYLKKGNQVLKLKSIF